MSKSFFIFSFLAIVAGGAYASPPSGEGAENLSAQDAQSARAYTVAPGQVGVVKVFERKMSLGVCDMEAGAYRKFAAEILSKWQLLSGDLGGGIIHSKTALCMNVGQTVTNAGRFEAPRIQLTCARLKDEGLSKGGTVSLKFQEAFFEHALYQVETSLTLALCEKPSKAAPGLEASQVPWKTVTLEPFDSCPIVLQGELSAEEGKLRIYGPCKVIMDS
jgi:hypothetical protein